MYPTITLTIIQEDCNDAIAVALIELRSKGNESNEMLIASIRPIRDKIPGHLMGKQFYE
jgi:hypothetical protein